MEFLIVLVILFAVVFIVTGPLRSGPRRGPTTGDAPAARVGAGAAAPAEELERESRRAELEAAREAKYREIRDAELDRDTGKLSDLDFEALESRLRADAVQILHELDRLEAAAVQGDPRTG